jgi:hypothetical protein
MKFIELFDSRDKKKRLSHIRKGNRYTYEEFYAMTAELRAANPLEE